MNKFSVCLGAAVLASLPAIAWAQAYSASANYANPDATTSDVARKRGPCADPWLTIALEKVYGRADAAKCDVKLYNGGRWSDYNTLVHAVARQKSAGPAKPTIDLTRIKYQCPSPNACSIFANSGEKVGMLTSGNFQAEVPQKMVAAGGGNLIGNDGSTMVAAGGGNLVGNDGASLIAKKVNLNPPASPMSGYALQGVNDFRALQAKTRSGG